MREERVLYKGNSTKHGKRHKGSGLQGERRRASGSQQLLFRTWSPCLACYGKTAYRRIPKKILKIRQSQGRSATDMANESVLCEAGGTEHVQAHRQSTAGRPSTCLAVSWALRDQPQARSEPAPWHQLSARGGQGTESGLQVCCPWHSSRRSHEPQVAT